MSGDLPNGNTRTIGTVVRPQKVAADKSVVQSVVDFFNDVLPQGSVPHKTNDKEVITWIKIEQPERLGSISDPHCPVYLTFGYANGVQVWAIEPHGEAWEVFSSRHGPVKTLRLLPLPEEVFGSGDAFAEKRPLIAVCDSSHGSNSHPGSSISIISLHTAEKVHIIKFRTAIEEIYCNQRVLVITFPDRFVVLDACTFKERVYVNASFPVYTVSPHPVALGKRWLAYSESKLHDVYHSLGGRMVDGVASYTASVISAAKSISQGISNISEVFASSISGVKKCSSGTFVTSTPEGKQEGVVTVLDIDSVGDGEVCLEKGSVNRNGVVAHFLAHSSSTVAALAFNVDGTLLLTASRTGQHFHIFRILPHPAGSSMTVVNHLYTLYRGDTNATLQDITFSLDSRWVAVTSLRATTHVFPITPYGGHITYRTHSATRVVNKASRFVKSAGLDELEDSGENGVSPIGSSTALNGTGSSSPRYAEPTTARVQVQAPSSVPNHAATSGGGISRGPQFRPPIVVQPLSQIKHSGPAKSMHNAPNSSSAKSPPSAATDTVRVAACFAERRSRAANEPHMCDALLIGTSHGALVEYSLQPVVAPEVERISEEVPVGLSVHAQAQWVLNRHLSHAEFLPPFSDSHPLLSSLAFSAKRRSLEEPVRYQDSNGGLERIVTLAVNSETEPWLSQVEMMTHAGPARRLWMGPQFRFTPISSPSCPSSVALSTSPYTEIHRTGSDWDLTNLKLTNMNIRSAPVSVPGVSNSNVALCTVDANSGSFDKAVFPEYITRDSSSSDDLRVSEIADAMADLHGRDFPDGALNPLKNKGGDCPDDSPEDLSVSSAESVFGGGQQGSPGFGNGGLSHQSPNGSPFDPTGNADTERNL